MLYNLKEVLNRNPIQISGAIGSGVNFAILMEWLSMTDKQVAGLNVFLLALLGLFVVTKTTNTSKLNELGGDGGQVTFETIRAILILVLVVLAIIVCVKYLGWVD